MLAAAKRRSLIDEVVKIEYGMARHVLRLQVVVLRDVKALLVVVITVLAGFIMAAAVNGATSVSESGQRWIARGTRCVRRPHGHGTVALTQATRHRAVSPTLTRVVAGRTATNSSHHPCTEGKSPAASAARMTAAPHADR